MLIKKNNFTLIEILVSLFLIGIIFTFVFRHFTYITIFEKKIDKAENKIYQMNNIYSHLTNSLSNIKIKNFDFSPFYTKRENKKYLLYFSFDNGIDPDPNYSYIVDAKLYIDNDNNLIFEIFKNNDLSIKSRKTLLFKNCLQIDFLFFSSKDKNLKKYLFENISSNFAFYDFWPEEKKNIPDCMLLTVNKNLQFAFFLPK